MTEHVPVTADLWLGIQRFLDDFVELGRDDSVTIAYTPDSRECTAWVILALRERAYKPSVVPMVPLRDTGFAKRLAGAIRSPLGKSGRRVVLVFERDTMSHSAAIRDVFRYCDPTTYTVVRAISTGPDLFISGTSTSPKTLSALNAAILDRCLSARSLRIETVAGTVLNVELDNSRFRWISNCGIGGPGKLIILPAGEVATFPARISGQLVADFALNVNTHFRGDVRLDKTPITAHIDENRLRYFECSNPPIRDFLSRSFSRSNATRVGELGFGTNRSVMIPVPENSHLNERVPGVHIGFGQHNQTDFLAGYSCDVHLDLCAKGGTISFDGSEDLLDLEMFDPSSKPHPKFVASEDVFAADGFRSVGTE